MKIYRKFGTPVEEVENFPLKREMTVKVVRRSNFMNTLGDDLPDTYIDVYKTPDGERFTITPKGDAMIFPYTDEELGKWNESNTVKYERVK